MSINVLYSGTMSAAVEGALEGIPSIGFSLLDHAYDADFSHCREVVKQVTKNALEKGIPADTCLNVNIPKKSEEPLKGFRVCRQGKAYWEDEFEERRDPHKKPYYWLAGEFKSFDKGLDTDVHALQNNFVSIVPVMYDMTAHHAIQHLNDWNHDEEA